MLEREKNEVILKMLMSASHPASRIGGAMLDDEASVNSDDSVEDRHEPRRRDRGYL